MVVAACQTSICVAPAIIAAAALGSAVVARSVGKAVLPRISTALLSDGEVLVMASPVLLPILLYLGGLGQFHD